MSEADSSARISGNSTGGTIGDYEVDAFNNVSGWIVATVLAAIPTTAVIFRTVILGGGDPQAIKEILNTLNLSTFLANVLLDLLRTGVGILIVLGLGLWHFRVKSPTEEYRRYLTFAYAGGMVALGAFAIWTTRSISIMIFSAAVVLIGTFLLALAEMRANTVGRTTVDRSLIFASYVIAPALAMLQLVSTLQWMPLELIKLKEVAPPEWGYVLTVTAIDTVILRDTGGIEIIPNASIESRAICPRIVLERLSKLSRLDEITPFRYTQASTIPAICQQALSTAIK